jgi:hypothetical protein
MFSSIKLACVFLVFAVSVCNCECFAPRNETEGGPCRNFTNNNILSILEELRERMYRPMPRFNVPVLEPMFVELLHLNNFGFLEGLDIQMINVSFIGFSGFQANDLDLNLVGFDLSLQLVFPMLEISGYHISNGSLLGLIPVIGEGPMNLTIANVTFDVVGRLNHTGLEWEVANITMNLTIGQIRGGFSNLTDNFLNELLELSGPELLELAWPSIAPTVEETVAGAVETFLNDFTMEELMRFLFAGEFDWEDPEPVPTSAAIPTYTLPTPLEVAAP